MFFYELGTNYFIIILIILNIIYVYIFTNNYSFVAWFLTSI